MTGRGRDGAVWHGAGAGRGRDRAVWHGAGAGRRRDGTVTGWKRDRSRGGRSLLVGRGPGAVLGALLRGALTGRVDFARAISLRSASDFDRPALGRSAAANLFEGQNAGYSVSVANVYRAGVQVVQGILEEWDSEYGKGVPPNNYIGDDVGSLGGHPDFGPGSRFGGLAPSIA